MPTPQKKITVTLKKISAPRTQRFRMKCPRPGMSQPASGATTDNISACGALADVAAAFAFAFSLAI
jgi:hypothetical protein